MFMLKCDQPRGRKVDDHHPKGPQTLLGTTGGKKSYDNYDYENDDDAYDNDDDFYNDDGDCIVFSSSLRTSNRVSTRGTLVPIKISVSSITVILSQIGVFNAFLAL